MLCRVHCEIPEHGRELSEPHRSADHGSLAAKEGQPISLGTGGQGRLPRAQWWHRVLKDRQDTVNIEEQVQIEGSLDRGNNTYRQNRRRHWVGQSIQTQVLPFPVQGEHGVRQAVVGKRAGESDGQGLEGKQDPRARQRMRMPRATALSLIHI